MKLVLTLPELGSEHKDNVLRAELLRAALEGAIETNCVILKHFNLPPLYKSGIRFRPETQKHYDLVPDYLTMLRTGIGDCAPLAAVRAAELRAQGEHATIKVYWRPKQLGQPMPYHAQVRRADGTIEDPARRLGMVGRNSH
jgi:hypothetical protein